MPLVFGPLLEHLDLIEYVIVDLLQVLFAEIRMFWMDSQRILLP